MDDNSPYPVNFGFNNVGQIPKRGENQLGFPVGSHLEYLRVSRAMPF
jgi:hypothetical protein